MTKNEKNELGFFTRSLLVLLQFAVGGALLYGTSHLVYLFSTL